MQTQAKKLTLKLILNLLSPEPKLSLKPKVGPSPSTEKLFLRLLA